MQAPSSEGSAEPASMEMRVRAAMIHWRGPSPYHFIPIPPRDGAKITAIARSLTYGWGVIPVRGRIGSTTFRTSLFPKDGTYLIPIKGSVRAAEGVELGHRVTVDLT